MRIKRVVVEFEDGSFWELKDVLWQYSRLSVSGTESAYTHLEMDVYGSELRRGVDVSTPEEEG